MIHQQINDEEAQLAKKIIELHGQGLGFRKIAKELRLQGFKVNKDRCNQLYKRYIAKIDSGSSEPENQSLAKLKKVEDRKAFCLKEAKQKLEIKNHIAVMHMEKSTLTYEQRQRLFDVPDYLLRLAWAVMPITYPQVWSTFVMFCECGDFDQADVLQKCLGDQSSYERQLTNSNFPRFDTYLSQKITEYMTYFRQKKENEFAGEQKPTNQLEENSTEIITLEFSEAADWQ